MLKLFRYKDLPVIRFMYPLFPLFEKTVVVSVEEECAIQLSLGVVALPIILID